MSTLVSNNFDLISFTEVDFLHTYFIIDTMCESYETSYHFCQRKFRIFNSDERKFT